jgi:hypothetical protein
VQHLPDKGDRTGGVEHRAGLLTQFPDARKYTMQMDR